MTLAHGASIVTNGLLLLLDAANSRSYPGTGTAWNDLSGQGTNSTLTASPPYSSSNLGYFTFNGSTQFALTTNPGGTITTGTVMAWVWRNGVQNGFTGIVYNRGTGNNILGLGTLGDGTNLSYTWNNSASTYDWLTGLTIPNQAWSMVAVSVGASTTTAYVNMSSVSQSYVPASMTFGAGWWVGRDSSSIRTWNGRISTAIVYNRALTTDEIAQNFNAYRGRYGI